MVILITNKKKEEEYFFGIEMGSNIILEEKIHTMSLVRPCPDCGCRMDEFNRCDCCGYVKLKMYSGIIR